MDFTKGIEKHLGNFEKDDIRVDVAGNSKELKFYGFLNGVMMAEYVVPYIYILQFVHRHQADAEITVSRSPLGYN